MEGQLHNLRALLRTFFENFRKDWKEFWSEDWYLSLNKAQTIAIVLLVLLLAGGSGILFFKRQRGKTVIKEVVERPVQAKDSGDPKGLKEAVSKSVFVHVCGAVTRPGVYELAVGERVNDAIALAGGTTAEADPNALNLAAKLTDGQRIYVPKVSESAPAAVVSPGNPVESGFPINLNLATLEQLDNLPGIGETLAKRIIEYRETYGGFKEVSELRNIEGIGEKKYNQIKDKVVVE